MYMFAQRQNYLMMHFSERIPIFKHCISIYNKVCLHLCSLNTVNFMNSIAYHNLKFLHALYFILHSHLKQSWLVMISVDMISHYSVFL